MGRRSRQTCLCPGRRKRHVQQPLLPADLFVALAEREICLSSFLLEKLHGQLASPALVRKGRVTVDLAHQGRGALVYQGLQVNIIDGRQGHVQEVARQGSDRGEVTVEKDCV